jgi:dihydroorotate dehydrogenase electron transfer subunit
VIQKFLAPVVWVEALMAPGHFVLTFDAPALAEHARPGHFIAVMADYPWGAGQQILRKPFSVYTVETEKGHCSILFSVYGPTTRFMSELKPGEKLDFLGPLGGKVFTKHPTATRHLLLGGGYGVPPLNFFAKQLKEQKNANATLIYGARTQNLLVGTDGLEALGVEVIACTDDGSFGVTGRVTDALEPILQSGESCAVYTCGPTPMMKAVAELSQKYNTPCQVSMETFMPCGIGICVGCVVPKPDGTYVRACTDGPVFEGSEIVW